MSKTFTIETVYKVYDDSNGMCVVVGYDTDGVGGLVRIHDGTKEKYFGGFDVLLEVGFAKALAQAIMKRVEEIENGGI